MNFKKLFSSCLSVLIASAPVSLYAMENNECPICLENLDKIDNQKKIALQCPKQHELCRDCFNEWKEKKGICPSCQIDIGPGPDLTTYFNNNGTFDIQQFLEFRQKSTDEIVELLVRNICNEDNGIVIYIEEENDITTRVANGNVNAGVIFLKNYVDGSVRVLQENGIRIGISNPFLRAKLRSKLKETISPVRLIRAALNAPDPDEVERLENERIQRVNQGRQMFITGGLFLLLLRVMML